LAMTPRKTVPVAFSHIGPDRATTGCGASTEFWTRAKAERRPDMIEADLDGLHTVQPCYRDRDLRKLKADFRGRSFSTAQSIRIML